MTAEDAGGSDSIDVNLTVFHSNAPPICNEITSDPYYGVTQYYADMTLILHNNKTIMSRMQTPREIVRRCLNFKNPSRMPRDLWLLPWAESRFWEILKAIRKRYPNDITSPPGVYNTSPRRKGDPHTIGTFTDEWGCTFENVQDGVIGEVKNPILTDFADLRNFKPPYEVLPDDKIKARDIINRFCSETELFVMSGCCPRPWERMQFLRGTESAMIDTSIPEAGGFSLLKLIHDFHMRELEFWVSTDVDAISFMDDWGAQNNLLISPETWRYLFKPLYKDYCDLAHANGKFAFMHSDGCIQSIFEDLIEVGVDALNSQLFTMDFGYLEKHAKGKITFWGEIDRQHVLPSKDPDIVIDAVRKVASHLYDPSGGIFIQFEMGAGFHGPNALLIYEEWEKIQTQTSR